MSDPPTAHQSSALLIWAGGVASTVAGAWITGRIRAYQEGKQAHLAHIKKEILEPVRESLAEYFLPLLTREQLPVTWKRETVGRPDFPSVLEPAFREELRLSTVAPHDEIFAAKPAGLLLDVRWRHHQALFDSIGSFLESWKKVAGDARQWVEKLADEILEVSELPAYPNTRNDGCVMHFAAAIYVYKRLCNSKTYALEYVPENRPTELRHGPEILVQGTPHQLSHVSQKMTEMIRSATHQSEGKGVLADIEVMHQKYRILRNELDLAIASQRLQGRCDLVPLLRIF
jgi:hypothetical protein